MNGYNKISVSVIFISKVKIFVNRIVFSWKNVFFFLFYLILFFLLKGNLIVISRIFTVQPVELILYKFIFFFFHFRFSYFFVHAMMPQGILYIKHRKHVLIHLPNQNKNKFLLLFVFGGYIIFFGGHNNQSTGNKRINFCDVFHFQYLFGHPSRENA